MCPYFSHETPLENQLFLGNALTYPRWFGAIICQCLLLIETFDLGQVLLCLFDRRFFVHQIFLVVWRPQLSLAPLTLIVTLASITWANFIFWVTLLPISPLGCVGVSFSIHSTIFINPWHVSRMSVL